MAETLTIRTASSTEVVKIASVGPQGATGQGVPAGGTTGQVLRKVSGTNYDTEWATGGGGASYDQELNTTDSVTFESVTADKVAFDLAAAETAAQGQLAWNADEETLDLGLAHGSVLQVGQETLYHVENSTASTITAGTLCVFSGTVGNSGKLRVAPHANNTNPTAILGIATSTIAAGVGEEGYITHFGKCRGINASGGAEAWANGDLLYASPTGGLTKTKPSAPIVTVAAVVSNSSSSGTLFVRPSFGQTAADVGAAPTSHAASHAAAGSDPVFDQDLNTSANVTFNEVTTDNNLIVGGDLTINNALVVGTNGVVFESATGNTTLTTLATAPRAVNLPDASGTLALTTTAPASHTHGNLTNDGKVGSTAGLPLVTTTAGAVTTLALGTAGQVLTVNSGATGVEFGAGFDAASPPAIGNTTPAAISATTLDASTSLTLGPSSATLASPAVLFAQNGRFSCTGTASDDVITATGHNFANGDDVSFVVLTGGSGLNTTTRYFVRDVSGDTFKVATTSGGSAVNFTTDITDGVINRVVGLRVNPSRLGYIMCGEPPDSAVLGGNPRGLGSVDWQHVRAEAVHSASGLYSVIAGGGLNRATARGSVCVGGESNVITGGHATGGGVGNTASGATSVAFGDNNSATAQSSGVLFGERGRADRYGMQAHGAGMFAAQGDAQRGRFVLRCKTTTNAAEEMALNGTTTYLTIPSGKVIFCNIKVVGVKSDGSAVATYERQYAAKNVAGTSSEVFAEVTIGTDNASSTSLDISTVDAGDYISIKPTGIASETWRWVASVDAVEVAYGS